MGKRRRETVGSVARAEEKLRRARKKAAKAAARAERKDTEKARKKAAKAARKLEKRVAELAAAKTRKRAVEGVTDVPPGKKACKIRGIRRADGSERGGFVCRKCERWAACRRCLCKPAKA